jgi:putative ABC transport system permease protein
MFFQQLKVSSFLAFKSITRGNKAVVFFTILMLVLVFLNLIFIPSLLEGLIQNVNSKQIDTSTSDILIESSKGQIENYQPVVDALREIPGVKGVTPRYMFGAEMRFNEKRSTWGITAINPEEDAEVFKIKEYLVAGNYLEETDTNGILMGIQVAGMSNENLALYTEALQTVQVGDVVDVYYGSGVKKEYTVRGIFSTDYIQTDTKSFITRKAFEEVSPELNQGSSLINVKVSDLKIQSEIQNKLKIIDSNLVVRNWKDTAGIIKDMTDSFIAIKAVVRASALIIAGITIFIITYIDLSSKRRQIGIERAIGIDPGSIITSYTLRAMFYAIIGAVIASLLFLFVIVPFELTHPFKFPFGYVYLVENYKELFAYSFLMIAVSITSAFIPAFKTTHVNILDAIWGN